MFEPRSSFVVRTHASAAARGPARAARRGPAPRAMAALRSRPPQALSFASPALAFANGAGGAAAAARMARGGGGGDAARGTECVEVRALTETLRGVFMRSSAQCHPGHVAFSEAPLGVVQTNAAAVPACAHCLRPLGPLALHARAQAAPAGAAAAARAALPPLPPLPLAADDDDDDGIGADASDASSCACPLGCADAVFCCARCVGAACGPEGWHGMLCCARLEPAHPLRLFFAHARATSPLFSLCARLLAGALAQARAAGGSPEAVFAALERLEVRARPARVAACSGDAPTSAPSRGAPRSFGRSPPLSRAAAPLALVPPASLPQHLQSPGLWWECAPATPPPPPPRTPAEAEAAARASRSGAAAAAASPPAPPASNANAELQAARYALCAKSCSLLSAGLVQARGLRAADYAPLLRLVRHTARSRAHAVTGIGTFRAPR
jgi:hypothetical protein